MDLSKELNEIKKIKGVKPKSLVNYVVEQNEIMQKKFHILYIFNIANAIDELAKQQVFEKDGVCYLEMEKGQDCALYDKHKCYIMEDNNSYNLLNKLIKNDSLNLDYIEGYTNTKIDLKRNIQEQIYKIFLTKDLKSLLDYNQIGIELTNNEPSNQKKSQSKV